MKQRITLNELQRIKQWHVAHRADHPVEYHLLDLVLTVWLMGCIGWLPAIVFGHTWALPVCAMAIVAPTSYIAWRERAHQRRALRCDWI